MPTTIVQAPVGAGKTEAALQRLTDAIVADDAPFARAWVLLASRRQESAFRQRLIDQQAQRNVYFNAEFFNFYSLNARLLNFAGQPQRRIDSSAQVGLLRMIVRQLLAEGDLPTFASIAETPGFVRVVRDLVVDLKQHLVAPNKYTQAAATDKDRELASIYARYQQLMQTHNMVDIEGEGWLALDAVQSLPEVPPRVDLLLVDGFDQFTPVQAHLLAALSQTIPDVYITLTAPPTAARQSFGQRFMQARQRLYDAHHAISVDIADPVTLSDTTTQKPDDLLALSRNLFNADADAVPVAEGVTMIEAPTIEDEVAAVLRDVKKRLLDGVRPDDMLIALRDWDQYYTFFQRYQHEYDLPLLLPYSTPISENPAVVVLMNVLQLAGRDPSARTAFKRRDLLDTLRSPYIAAEGLDTDAVDLLDRISQEKQVVGGRQAWLDAVDSANEPVYDYENDEERPPLISTGEWSNLETALCDFFKSVTLSERGTIKKYVIEIEELIGQDEVMTPDERAERRDQPEFDEQGKLTTEQHYSLDMIACIRAMPDDTVEAERIIARDIAALDQFKAILKGMVQTQEFLTTTVEREEPVFTRDEFLNELTTHLKNSVSARRDPTRSGRVLVTTATDARGLPHEHVYILGLSETIFPAEVPEDPLHLPHEIHDLRERGVYLPTPDERTDDTGIFYELIRLPATQLVLSRPTVKDGKPWVESHLWRKVRDVFDGLVPRTYHIGEVVPSGEVTSLQEAILAVADGLSHDRVDDVLDIYQWLQADGEAHTRWQHILQGRATDVDRLSTQPHSAYSGRLTDPVLIEQAAQKLGKGHRWSASQLNDFGLCGYRYFAKRLLKLEAITEPEAGLDALQLGSLNHAILEKTYQDIGDAGLVITPDNQADAIEILHMCAREVLEHAQETYGFRATALWQEEQQVLLRRLAALVTLDFSAESPITKKFAGERRPFKLEWEFGTAENDVRIPLASGERIRVRGSIDRVDIVDGSHLVVVDYKTGGSGISTKDMREGRNFQMSVYLLALRELVAQENLSHQIAGGLFWHIRNQDTSGVLTVETSLESVDEIAAGMQHAARYLQQGRDGHFVVKPTSIDNGRCASYCDYYQLCRLAVTNQYKREG